MHLYNCSIYSSSVQDYTVKKTEAIKSQTKSIKSETKLVVSKIGVVLTIKNEHSFIILKLLT
jgi:hypothetical protein